VTLGLAERRPCTSLQVAAMALVLLPIAACAPLGSFRPASALSGDRSWELGLGAVAVGPRPYVDEDWKQAGQAWLSTRATPWLNVSAISAFDPRAAALGVGAVALPIRGSRFIGGVEGELGYGWGALALPAALRLFEQNWIYASPRVGNFGIYPSVGVPLGLSLHVRKGAFLRIEYQATWVELRAYNFRSHLGAAMAVQW
jgi:hypothetical protein